jgi:hypothetical protein
MSGESLNGPRIVRKGSNLPVRRTVRYGAKMRPGATVPERSLGCGNARYLRIPVVPNEDGAPPNRHKTIALVPATIT